MQFVLHVNHLRERRFYTEPMRVARPLPRHRVAFIYSFLVGRRAKLITRTNVTLQKLEISRPIESLGFEPVSPP